MTRLLNEYGWFTATCLAFEFLAMASGEVLSDFLTIDSIIMVILEGITIDFKQKSESKAPVPICILFHFLIDSML